MQLLPFSQSLANLRRKKSGFSATALRELNISVVFEPHIKISATPALYGYWSGRTSGFVHLLGHLMGRGGNGEDGSLSVSESEDPRFHTRARVRPHVQAVASCTLVVTYTVPSMKAVSAAY